MISLCLEVLVSEPIKVDNHSAPSESQNPGPWQRRCQVKTVLCLRKGPGPEVHLVEHPISR